MTNTLLYIKWKYIKFLEKIKPKNINKCIAIVYDRKCNELTKYKYCYNHYKIMKEYCNLYHYWNNRYKYQDVELYNLIDTEIKMRKQYEYIFNLYLDYNHNKWIKFLEYQRDNITYKLNDKYHNLYNEIMYFKIDTYFIKNLDYLNLDINLIENTLSFDYIDDKIYKFKKIDIFTDYFDKYIYEYRYIYKRMSVS
ncbi:unknown similar to AMEV022 [Mythimna separata entomopoxvirus 'L']|uniref:Uncharacterized protein n=1 Tax=Mythimna separata entomopoxvirus 'L' TaxID=1293572 RepID=A0A916NYC6_9POXV|nr:unknown similar to AMEV022 [Mythimna separata entomopoxvirus 'L']CCU56244.1 unknown similar to AMEV022 [Mythimna separata entomopoxvirus 'L']